MASPFNSTAVRKTDFVREDTRDMPGPANYIVEPLEKPKAAVTCCHLRSKTDRFPKDALCVSNSPNICLQFSSTGEIIATYEILLVSTLMQ